jgi:hypothetical protein
LALYDSFEHVGERGTQKEKCTYRERMGITIIALRGGFLAKVIPDTTDNI